MDKKLIKKAVNYSFLKNYLFLKISKDRFIDLRELKTILLALEEREEEENE